MNLKPWIAAALIGTGGIAVAQDNSTLSVEGEEMVTETAAPAHLDNVRTIYSGWRFRTPETQALQMDDFENPAMIFVDQALDLWDTVDGTEGHSCSS